MNILRLQIYQPQAHYRVPFTYQRRHTYPLPPYSTVIGFLCNVLGIDHQDKKEKINGKEVRLYDELRRLKISIAGQFESKTTEYIWFRNLSINSHNARFGSPQNREVNGHVEHIGGQSPISIDVLNDMRLKLYFAHEDKDFLSYLKSELQNPVHRLEVLHLGRAEDWIVLEEVSDILDDKQFKPRKRDGNYRHFFWIPSNIWMRDAIPSFERAEGLLYNVPTFWTIVGFKETLNRHGPRNFEFMRTKLNDGLFIGHSFLFDEQLNLPIFLADFEHANTN